MTLNAAVHRGGMVRSATRFRVTVNGECGAVALQGDGGRFSLAQTSDASHYATMLREIADWIDGHAHA